MSGQGPDLRPPAQSCQMAPALDDDEALDDLEIIDEVDSAAPLRFTNGKAAVVSVVDVAVLPADADEEMEDEPACPAPLAPAPARVSAHAPAKFTSLAVIVPPSTTQPELQPLVGTVDELGLDGASGDDGEDRQTEPASDSGSDSDSDSASDSGAARRRRKLRKKEKKRLKKLKKKEKKRRKKAAKKAKREKKKQRRRRRSATTSSSYSSSSSERSDSDTSSNSSSSFEESLSEYEESDSDAGAAAAEPPVVVVAAAAGVPLAVAALKIPTAVAPSQSPSDADEFELPERPSAAELGALGSPSQSPAGDCDLEDLGSLTIDTGMGSSAAAQSIISPIRPPDSAAAPADARRASRGPYSAAFELGAAEQAAVDAVATPAPGSALESYYEWPRVALAWFKYFGELQCWQQLGCSGTPSQVLWPDGYVDPPHWQRLPVQQGWVQKVDAPEPPQAAAQVSQSRGAGHGGSGTPATVMGMSRLGRAYRVPVNQPRMLHKGRRHRDELRWYNKFNRLWQDQRPVMLSQIWEEQFVSHGDRHVRFVNRITTRGQAHRPVPVDLLPATEAEVLKQLHRLHELMLRGAAFTRLQTRFVREGSTPSSPCSSYSANSPGSPQHFSSVSQGSALPKRRWVWLSTNGAYLCWGRAEGGLLVKGRIGVSRITGIRQHTLGSFIGPAAERRVLAGAQGNPERLRAASAKLQSLTPHLLVTTSELVLELEAADAAQARDWYNGLVQAFRVRQYFDQKLQQLMAGEDFWLRFDRAKGEHREHMTSGIACLRWTGSGALRRQDLSALPQLPTPSSQLVPGTPRAAGAAGAKTPRGSPQPRTPRSRSSRHSTPSTPSAAAGGGGGKAFSSFQAAAPPPTPPAELPGHLCESLGCTEGLWQLPELSRRSAKPCLVWFSENWRDLCWGPTLSKTKGSVCSADLIDVHVDSKVPNRVTILCHGRNLELSVVNAGSADDLVRSVSFLINFRSHIVHDANLMRSLRKSGTLSKLLPWK